MKFLRLLARVRYWKCRALRAETRCLELIETHAAEKAALEAESDAEMWRNRMREDTFVSAAVLGSKGMWGLAPRTGPASIQKPPSLLEATHPIMTGADKMEFEQFWLPDAERAGVPRQRAEQEFLAELAKRRALNDEPSM